MTTPAPADSTMGQPSSSSPSVNHSGWQVYKRLLSYIRPYSFFFIFSIVGFLVYGVTQAALAHMMEEFINALESPTDSVLYFIPALVVGLAFTRGLSYFVANYSMSRVALGVVNDLRKNLFNHFLHLPSEFFDRRNSAELVAIITYNINQVNNSASNAVKTVFREGFTVIALLAYLFYQNWLLTLIFLAITPLMALVVSVASKRFRTLSKKIQSSMGNLAQVADESVGGYRLVRSYGGQPYERERFFQSSNKNTREGVKFSVVHSLQTPVLQLILSMVLALLMFLVLFLGSKDAGSTVAYLVAAGLLARPIRALSQVNGMIQKGIAAAESVFSVLDTSVEEDVGTVEKTHIDGEIELNGVSFAYNEHDGAVLENIHLTMKAGQTVALVGRSGSGKTTLASLISRYYEPSKGVITLDGTPLQEYTLTNLRSHLALVSQQVTLFNGTVAENIAYGDLASKSMEDIREAAKAANALTFIEEQLPDGFDTQIGEGGTRLSGGQRQRIAIARALLKNAPLLILDEATSALDTESERQIQTALDTLMSDRTTLVIAHRLSTIEKADNIVVLDKGKIVEMGNHETLIAQQGIYAQLHAVQFDEASDS
ncbi:lipid A export permease/ATP-binding protein MsbA [Marinibactrum halimedae]|uniref:Lipid A export ATP-binding/permease protein MsbA n=1 Tax=Marinibactrum halimedae TaxID=1444977 RepID=A0AA37WLB0_9GAMM|nr:lipid A export permease/ATP-binding protein MsbA [Marinibactrum halimedae]MCD9459334.1 lipid A export permease/ATP-binding protein MsbA [Marinibactrum halimedae]GLS25774.1 lipid A export ATP-binding/permease protein MsbA [Marinibactrum halimedae]